MKKGIFLHFNSDPNIEASGEVKKVKMQIDALRKWGILVDEICVDKSSTADKVIRRLPLFPANGIGLYKVLKTKQIENCDFIYIRKYIIDIWFLHLLKKIKQINTKIKIIFEIPTYPYDLEWSRLFDKPLLWKERISRTRLLKYVDRIVTLSEDNKIWNIPTIRINNGIDIEKFSVVHKQEKNNNVIVLLGVALLAKWHGYDRVIKGMKTYYEKKPNKKVLFLIVGEGPELKRLRQEVDSYGLNEHVKFLGKKHGEELEELYNQADVAIGSLGYYRIGLEYGTTLKIREYCAKGIPFIKGYKDKTFDEAKFKYVLDFPNDDSEIDIFEIVNFYSLLSNIGSIQNEMHKFAEENFTWKNEMRPVVIYLNSETGDDKIL